MEYHGVQFDQEVDLVEDYGADPTGSDPVDSAVAAAADANTLVEVPEGEYLFSGKVSLSPGGNVGFRAKDGATPRFVAPSGFNDWLLKFYGGSKVLFEGIDVDIRKTDTTAGLFFGADDQVHAEDIEYLGRGTHPDSSVVNAMAVWMSNDTATGVVRNVRALKGSAIGHHGSGSGRVGLYSGDSGTLRVEDCHFEEFGNNALYLSKRYGPVEVIGGTYRNNNVAQVRIGGDNASVDGATIEVDLDAYSGPAIEDGDAHNTRGVWLENSHSKTPGATVRNCDITFGRVERSTGGVVVWGSSGERTAYVSNTSFQMDAYAVEAVEAEGAQVHLDGVQVTGAAADAEAVDLEGSYASGSSVTNCCFEQTGSSRNGIVADGATDVTVTDSNVNVTGIACAEVNGGSISMSNVTYDGSCTAGPTVATETTSGVGETTATLNGTLSDLGGASSADVSFDYRESGASTWSSTGTQTLSSTGSFSADVSGLAGGTDYEYRAVATASDGDTATGSTVAFTTGTTDTAVAVATDAASNVTGSGATLNGTLSDLGGASSADVSFDYRESGASSWNSTGTQTLSSTGAFSVDVSGLTSGTDYEYRAVAAASDGDTATGSTVTFTTDAATSTTTSDSVPTVSRYSVTEAGSPNPHAEISVDWAVGDADGDLATVEVTVSDASGSAVGSVSRSVSGTDASGTETFKIKHVNGATFEVSLTVTDSNANSASATETVTE